MDEAFILASVARWRFHHPRLGAKKLYHVLSGEFEEAGITIGRDRFIEVLRDHDRLVKPLPRRGKVTTNSRHSLPVFRNLIQKIEATGPDQIWVSDITYVRTLEGFEYLTLIMDLYSRKIIGWRCSDGLDAQSNLIALHQALGGLQEDRYPIHHSDRGCQYCCHEYVGALLDRGLVISMTEVLHCYENSHAERLNGILKQEYALGTTFRTREDARRAVDQAVTLYNHNRPHGSLDNRFPAEVYAIAA